MAWQKEVARYLKKGQLLDELVRLILGYVCPFILREVPADHFRYMPELANTYSREDPPVELGILGKRLFLKFRNQAWQRIRLAFASFGEILLLQSDKERKRSRFLVTYRQNHRSYIADFCFGHSTQQLVAQRLSLPRSLFVHWRIDHNLNYLYCIWLEDKQNLSVHTYMYHYPIADFQPICKRKRKHSEAYMRATWVPEVHVLSEPEEIRTLNCEFSLHPVLQPKMGIGNQGLFVWLWDADGISHLLSS